MPNVNPFVETDITYRTLGGPNPSETKHPSVTDLYQHAINDPNAIMNPMSSADNAQNAAGTQENTAMHVAVLVVVAMLGVYFLRQTGFRFVVAASVGK